MKDFVFGAACYEEYAQARFVCPFSGTDVLTGLAYRAGREAQLEAWGVIAVQSR